MELETVIGLEIHAQLSTASKIFCGCATTFGAPPNSNTCPVCLGMPGVLPVLNRKVVDAAIKLALATNADINHVSQFARKNYFYPDLPKGYQTSQFDQPVVGPGHVDIRTADGLKRIGITRIHMEEDAGKLLHDDVEPISHVDLNRAGTPLLEIVSEPDLRSPEEAVAYLKQIHAILRYLDICDGNMQEGSFRCDANISLRPSGQKEFGTRTELKNMNSFRHVQAALEYEIRRQRDILLDGGVIVQETRLWNPETNRSESMRGKEDAHDYRYFPCPDLVPITISQEWIDSIQSKMPELQDARLRRFQAQYLLPDHDAALLTSDRDLADYYEAAVAAGGTPKKTSNWIMTELIRELKGEALDTCRVTPENLAVLLKLIDDGTISGKIAKTVFVDMMVSGSDPKKIISEKNLGQLSDSGEIGFLVEKIISEFPEQVAEYRAGKNKVLGFFVGKLMQQTRGKANPQMANDLFVQALQGAQD
jgi:aspartyl-tRNA(Asn)/glutamyl-tRNA(Gln) amidotransferase subunit B